MIAITGGGTGGHLSIAKAVCEELNRRDIKPIFIGSTKGQDRAWFEHFEGFSKAYFLQTSGVVDKKGFGKLKSLKNILSQSKVCKDIFKTHNIKTVFSVGGYSSAPASIAAITNQKKLYIHEQNAAIGRLNKILKPFAKEVFGSYDNATFYTPYPIRDVFFDSSRERKELKTVLFLGGSGGANFINNLAKELATKLNEDNINIIHQCGKNDFDELKKFYKKHNIKADLFDFSKELHTKMKQADFAISRAGASTLWELTAMGLPTFFIPYPFAAANHQYYNAKELSDKKLAFLLPQKDVNDGVVLKVMKNANLEQISNSLHKKIEKNGVKTIVDIMLDQYHTEKYEHK